MSGPCKVAVRLPDPALPQADWADAFELALPGKGLTAIEATWLTLGRLPRWAGWLLRLRNALARLVGLKTGPGTEAGDHRIGIFPILFESPERVVLGLDDWHLDFRIVIEVERDGDGTTLRASTLVRRKNLFGTIYIGLVGPFHRRIVPATLRGAL